MTNPPLSAPDELCGRLAELLTKANEPSDVMPDYRDAVIKAKAAAWEALPLLLADRTALMAWKEEAEKVIEPFARLARPINGEEGRPTYLEAVEGKDGTGELYIGSHFGTTSYETMYHDDFRAAALLASKGDGAK